MADSEHKVNEPASGFDPAIQTEKIAFDSDQMVECSSCSRLNPPNRSRCLYCGTIFEIERLEDSLLNTGFRRLDPWEPGFSLVSDPSSKEVVSDFSAASQLLSLDPAELQAAMRTPVPVPLCRLESERQCLAVQKLIAGFGIYSTIVDDRALAVDKPPVRLSGITFSDSELTVKTFNSQEELPIPYEDIRLLVDGVISVSKVDQTEKRKRGSTKVLDEVSTIFDDLVLDIYSSKDNLGFRIMTIGFNFSCLGSDKGWIAADNLKSLVRMLSAACPNSRTVTEFGSLRALISRVWDVELRRDTKGLHVTGFGKREIGSVLSTNNLEQFTKFSRLQNFLL